MIRNRGLTRRTFLRGLAGSALALPLLEMNLARSAFAQDIMSADGFPKRFIYFFHPNGTIQDSWWPTAGGSTREFQMSRILEPLEMMKHKLIIPKGIELKSGSGSVGPGEPHQRGMGTLLSGYPLQEGSFVGGDGSLAGWGGGETLDQILADHIGAQTPFGSIQLGVRSDTTSPTAEVRTRISYRAAGEPLPPINEPRVVFDQLFSDFATAPDELQEVRARRKSVLDAVRDQFSTLNTRAGYADRLRLEQHMEIIRDLEVRLQSEGVSGQACYAPERPEELNADHEDTMPEISELQIDLLVMAMACDLTRVGSIQYSNAKNHIRFPWLESLGDGHQLSHAGPSNTRAHEEWIARDRWFASQFNYLLTKLDAIQEGDGTMLDNTVILWINELSQGNTHSQNNMPFVLAGSGGGFFDVGQYIDFGNVSHTDLLVNVQHCFGIDSEVFGDPRFCNGPLAGITR